MLLALLVYVNTSISFNEMGSTAQLMAGIPLIFWWFVVVGIRIDAAIFAAVALTPSTLLLGFGYFKLPSIALTLSDIFTLVAMCIFLVSPQRLQRKKFNKLIWLLLATCTVSIFFAANPIAHFGQLIRLGFSVGLISIVLSSRTDNNNKGVFFGMMLWPIIVMAHLAGVEGLWRFISFDNMAALNSADTGEVLLGSHMVVQNLFFLIPLLLFLKLKKVSIIIILLWLTVLIVFSNSRSLVIGVGATLTAYFLFGNTDKKNLGKLLLLAFLTAGLIIGVGSKNFFNFSTEDGAKVESTFIRASKMLRVWDTFTSNPVLGIGYGASGAIDIKKVSAAISEIDIDFLDVIIDVKASAEFTPLQILAETGLAGGAICLLLLIYSARHSLALLKNPNRPYVLKITLLCVNVLFITSFLGSNGFAGLVFWLAMPLILDGISSQTFKTSRLREIQRR